MLSRLLRIAGFALLVVVVAVADATAADCFLLQRLGAKEIVRVGGPECELRSAPASTFKVLHALIALETRAIRPGEKLIWDKTNHPFESWKRDHDLESAIKSSVPWFFQRTASRIGRKRMLQTLGEARYGSATFAGDVTSFWTNGDLTISPVEQLDFLRRFFSYQLGRRKNVDVVKNAMLMPPGKISTAAGLHGFALKWPGAVVRAKTGNTQVGNDYISWLVGHVESGGKQYIFVSRVRAPNRLLLTAGVQLALRHLNARKP